MSTKVVEVRYYNLDTGIAQVSFHPLGCTITEASGSIHRESSAKWLKQWYPTIRQDTIEDKVIGTRFTR